MKLGSRGLIGIKYENIFVGITNSFNAFPDKLGFWVIEVIKELLKENGMPKFKERLKQLIITSGDYKPELSHRMLFSNRGNVKIESTKTREDLENGEFLRRIYNGNLKKISNEILFGYNGLFCEFAYILNLDTYKLEFYMGNRPNFLSDKTGLFSNYICNISDDRKHTYYSVQKIEEYSLTSLPTIKILREEESKRKWVG